MGQPGCQKRTVEGGQAAHPQDVKGAGSKGTLGGRVGGWAGPEDEGCNDTQDLGRGLPGRRILGNWCPVGKTQVSCSVDRSPRRE